MEKDRQLCVVSSAAFPRCQPVELQVCGSALDLPVYGSACVPGPTGVWVSAGERSLNQSEDHAGLTMVRTNSSEWCDV